MDDRTVRNKRAIEVADPVLARSTERHSIQSVDRAVTLLEAIAEAGGESTLTELSHRTQLNISTCHHLLSTLVQRGYVAKVPVRRSYALGARILYLSNACLRQVDLPARAAPFIEKINERTGETVHLAVLQGDAMMKVAKRESRHPVRVDTGTLGKTDAAHATATGKAMLAWLPEDDMRRVLSHGLTRFTPKTITEWPTLIEALAPCAAQRLCDRRRGIPAGRDLHRRRDPRPQWRGGRRDQRLDADHAGERRAPVARARAGLLGGACALRRARRTRLAGRPPAAAE